MSTDFLKECKDLFEASYIKELNLSEHEKLIYFPIIKQIVDEQNLCDKLPPDVCVNENFTHTRLARDNNNKIIVTIVPCSKHKRQNNSIYDDFVEIDKKNLTMSQLCNSLVDEMWEYLPSNNVLDINLSYPEKFKVLKKQDFYKNSKLQIINAFLNPEFQAIKKDNDVSKINGIYIYGSYGVGKTLLMHTFLNALQNENLKTIFIKTATLSKMLKNNFDKANIVNEKIINNFKKVDVLVFDDIGVSDSTEWFINQVLFEILDERYNTKKLTYFTSNFSLKQLFIKFKSASKLSAIDIDRVIDRIKALTNNTEVEIKEKNHRYSNNK